MDLKEKMADGKLVSEVTNVIKSKINKWLADNNKKIKHWQEVLMVDFIFKSLVDKTHSRIDPKKQYVNDNVFRKQDFDYDEEQGFYVLYGPDVKAKLDSISDELISAAYAHAEDSIDITLNSYIPENQFRFKHIKMFEEYCLESERVVEGIGPR